MFTHKALLIDGLGQAMQLADNVSFLLVFRLGVYSVLFDWVPYIPVVSTTRLN